MRSAFDNVTCWSFRGRTTKECAQGKLRILCAVLTASTSSDRNVPYMLKRHSS
ncbi:hypothetical protein BDR04DRAFT_1093886 [Suillus decipiens]|nr:hypothetical protein BDR04DRAFT_1093886 [Suillus decipiens]